MQKKSIKNETKHNQKFQKRENEFKHTAMILKVLVHFAPFARNSHTECEKPKLFFGELFPNDNNEGGELKKTLEKWRI